MPRTASKRVEGKNALSLLLSGAALVISLTSLYFNYFRVHDEVLARITDVSFDPASNDPQSAYTKNGFVVLRVAFTNTGNRQAVINLPAYDLGRRRGGLDEPDGFGGPAATEEKAFPFVLPPQEIRIVPVSIPVACMVAAFERGIEPPPSPRRGPFRLFEVGLTYRAVDSAGQPHTAWSRRQVYVRVSPTGWDGYGPVDQAVSPSGTFIPTQLFGSSTIERPERTMTLFVPPEPNCGNLLRK